MKEMHLLIIQSFSNCPNNNNNNNNNTLSISLSIFAERCFIVLRCNNQTDQGLGRERERDQRGGIREEGTGKGWSHGICFSQVPPAVALLDQEKLQHCHWLFPKLGFCGFFQFVIKGSVKWKKRGGLSGTNGWSFNLSTFPQIFYYFLKDPGPLNHKKRFSAA